MGAIGGDGGRLRARAERRTSAQRTLAAIAAHIKDMDLVVTTAQIPGRAGAAAHHRRDGRSRCAPGSVIVDLAAETGGNCELTQAGRDDRRRTTSRSSAPLNLPSTVPFHASQMFGRNMLELLKHLVKDGALVVDPADEITGAMMS